MPCIPMAEKRVAVASNAHSFSHSMRLEERRALVRDPPEEAIMKNAATSVAAGQAKDATSSVVSLRGRGSHWKEEAPTLSGRIVPSIAS